MCKITERKTRLRFETAARVFERGKGREVMVDVGPYTAIVRLKGSRRCYELPWESIFRTAVSVHVERERREKKAAKKAGKR